MNHCKISGANVDTRRQQWKSLQPTPCLQYDWPRLDETWLEIAPWPPWFLAAAWEWTTQLCWPEAVGQSGRHGGVTYVELLANFVAVTKTIPPLKETGAKVTAVDPLEASGVLYPVILKECIMTLVAAVRVRCLELVGHKQPKRGICPRPGLPKLDVTFGLVEDLLNGGSPGESLREFAMDRTVKLFPSTSALHRRWQAAR